MSFALLRPPGPALTLWAPLLCLAAMGGVARAAVTSPVAQYPVDPWQCEEPVVEAPPEGLCDAPLVVVISGGISRGAYQAGQMYTLSNWIRERVPGCLAENPAWTVTVVGSSAGSINAVLLAADLLTNPHAPWTETPEDSLFFRTWVPLGFDNSEHSLDWVDTQSRAETRGVQALLNTERLRGVVVGLAEAVNSRLAAGPPTHTLPAVRLAVTMARHSPVSDDNGIRLDVTEGFGFELTAPESGGPRQVKACPLRQGQPGGPPQPVEVRGVDLVEGPRPGFDLADVAWMAVGSSSIPVAFPLREMTCEEFKALSPANDVQCFGVSAPTHVIRHDGETTSLKPADTPLGVTAARTSPPRPDSLWMMDGGTLEGNPVRVGAYFARPGCQSAAPQYIYLDPDLVGAQIGKAPVVDSMWQRYLQIVGVQGAPSSLLHAARNQSISLLFEYDPDVFARTRFVRTVTPPYGNLIGGFFAFYDRSIRVWDFFAGLQDQHTWSQSETGRPTDDAPLPSSRPTVPEASLFNAWAAMTLPGADDQRVAEAAAPPDVWEQTLCGIVRLEALSPAADTPPPPEPVAAGPDAARRDPCASPGGAFSWGGGHADGQDLWDNLRYLSALHRTTAGEDTAGLCAPTQRGEDAAPAPQGRPNLDAAREHHLQTGWQCGGLEFTPWDLGDGPLTKEVRQRLTWQLAQLYKRDALTDADAVDHLGAVVNQALLGGIGHWAWAIGTPMHDHRIPAVLMGPGFTFGQEHRVSFPVDLMLGVDLPHPAYTSDVSYALGAWEWAAGLDLRAGLQIGKQPKDQSLAVGPHHRLDVGAQAVLRASLELNCHLPDEGQALPTDGEVTDADATSIYDGRPGKHWILGEEDTRQCVALVPGLNFPHLSFGDAVSFDFITFPFFFWGGLSKEAHPGAVVHAQLSVEVPLRPPGDLKRWPR